MERRRRRIIWISAAAAVVVIGGTAAIAGPAIYRNSIAGEADAAPSIAATREASTLDASKLSGDWTIGSGSYAGYRVDEVLNGQPVTVTGRTKKVSGSATVSGSDITAATVTVDVGSIATDSGNRDAYFRDSAMDASAFPTATFTTTETIADAVPASGTATAKQQVTGKLTLHGVTKTVTATITSALSGDGADVTGSIPITFADYGVDAPSLGFVKVEDTGSVEFLVHATPKA